MTDPRETDLFGNPVRPGKGLRGRPRREWTETELDMLEAALAKGWSNQRTAEAMGVGVTTLKRNFGPLLKERMHISDRLRLALFAATARKAIGKADMGAVRQLRQMMQEDEAGAISESLQKAAEDDREERAVGKKEQQRREATKIAEGGDAGEWGEDLMPGYAQ